eukprot:TRINITY_DN167_c5_g1_i1.p1 TRINITY_DN167_c5_g1~~TRINITY_DN167_c5_g1_i1.p1  ORF type:complete len:1178 (+),score=282.55 TRINITY_DN167_c5_g1_i1:2704-6237(+)
MGSQQEKAKLLEEFAALKGELDKSQSIYEELNNQLKNTEEARDQLKLEVAKSKGESQILQNRVDALEKEVELLRANLSQLEALNSEKNKVESDLRQELEGRTKEWEELGKTVDELKLNLENLRENMEIKESEWKEKYEVIERERNELQEKIEGLYTGISEEKAAKTMAEGVIKRLEESLAEIKERHESTLKELNDTNMSKQELENKVSEILRNKENECEALRQEVDSYKQKEAALALEVAEKYSLSLEERTNIDKLYGRYTETIRMFEEYVQKYQEEKTRADQLEEKLTVVLNEMESKGPLVAAQKKAYEELVIAYKHKVRQFEQKCEELENTNRELEKLRMGVVQEPPRIPEVPIELTTLQARVNELEQESTTLKSELQNVVEAKERNEKAQKQWYDSELIKREAYTQQITNKLETLIASISVSEKFYEQFANHSAQLIENITKMSERQYEVVLPTSPSVDTEEKLATMVKTVNKLEQEKSTLQITLSFKEQEVSRVSEELTLWRERADYYAQWVEELKSQLKDIENDKDKQTELARETERKQAAVNLAKMQEELKQAEEKIFQAQTELTISLEGEKRYKEQNESLRVEVQKIGENFDNLRQKLIETSLSQYNLVKDALEKTKKPSIEPQGKTGESLAEEATLLKLRNENLSVINHALKSKVSELTSKLQELEAVFTQLEKSLTVSVQVISAREGGKVDQDRIVKLQRLAEEMGKKREPKGEEAQEKLQEYEKEIHRLKEIVARQQADYANVINANEQIIEDLQRQFYAFNDAANKEISALKMELENAKIEKTHELSTVKKEKQALQEEVEKLKKEASDSALSMGQIREQLESKSKVQNEKDKEMEHMRQQASEERKKYEEDLLEKQNELAKIYELNDIIQKLRVDLELREQNLQTAERQMKAQADTYEKIKAELEAQVKDLKERESSLQKRLETFETLQATSEMTDQPTEAGNLIQTLTAENHSLEFNLERLRADLIAVRAELAKVSAENDKLKGEHAVLVKALEVLRVICNFEQRKTEEVKEHLAELLNMETLKRERTAIDRKLERLQEESKERTKLVEEKEKEIVSSQYRLSEQSSKIRMLTEALNKEEVKEEKKQQPATNPFIKKVVDLSKKAKMIIDIKNIAIEELKKEKEQLSRMVEEGKSEEEPMSHKRKKVEEPQWIYHQLAHLYGSQ